MTAFEQRNQHFDRLVENKKLKWLGQNTNHYPAHESVRAAMIDCLREEEFHIYAPPLGLEELRSLVASDLRLQDMSTLITDGAVAGLYHLCHALCRSGDQFVTTDPTWAWPMSFARAAGAEITQIPIYGDEHSYRLDPDRLKAVVSNKTKVIYLVDPNNPIGTACTRAEIEAIADIARRAGAYLIHDCTYRDFADEHHLAAHVYPERTITVWSFSKWLGFAGLRIGAIVADRKLMEELCQAPPNNLGSNIVAQRGAIAGLTVKSKWFPEVQAAQRKNQQLVRTAVGGIPGLRLPVFPSQGNFLVIECGEAGIRPEALCAVMAQHDILIRQGVYHTKMFGDRFVKVSVSVPQEWVEEFCRLLPNAVEEARGINETIQLY